MSFTGELQSDTNFVIEGNSDVFGGGTERKIIDLAQEENLVAHEGTRVDGFVVGGVLESKVRAGEDGIDVAFPETAGFGVTLESVLNWEDHGAIQPDTETEEIPFIICVVDGNKCGHGRRGGMCVRIFGITTI